MTLPHFQQMPQQPPEERRFAAAGIAAYVAAAARMQTILGPAQSLTLVA